jgi:hypothetical protein
MPTDRPRHMVTETPEIAARLDLAARLYPELAGQRKALLLRLTELGERALRAQEPGGGDRRAAAKQALLDRTSRISDADADEMLAARETGWNRPIES